MDKLSMLSDNLELVDDRNKISRNNCLTIMIYYIVTYFPWELLPLICIPVNYLLLIYQPRAEIPPVA